MFSVHVSPNQIDALGEAGHEDALEDDLILAAAWRLAADLRIVLARFAQHARRGNGVVANAGVCRRMSGHHWRTRECTGDGRGEVEERGVAGGVVQIDEAAEDDARVVGVDLQARGIALGVWAGMS